jgi:Ca-activated chloride channel family protein
MAEHNELRLLINAYHDGEILSIDKDRVEAHLAVCPDCRKYRRQLENLSAALKTWPDEGLSMDLEQKIKSQAAGNRIPDRSSIKERFPYMALSAAALCLVILSVSFQVYQDYGRDRLARYPLAQEKAEEGKAFRDRGISDTEEDQSSVLVKPLAAPADVSAVVSRDQDKDFPSALQPAAAAPYYSQKGVFSPGRQTVGRSTEKASLSKISGVEENYGLWVNAPSQKMEARMPARDAFQSAGGAVPKVLLGKSMKQKGDLLDRSLKPAALPSHYANEADRPVLEDSLSVGRSYGVKGQTFYKEPGPLAAPIFGDQGTERYDQITERAFVSPLDNPLSTFSIDVDTAAYSNIRRFLTEGRRPPRDAVRIEEMINYFIYDYPQPQGDQPFSITLEAGDCPWNTGHTLVMIGLKGKELTSEEMPPSHLIFLIDVSGSMNDPNKLPLLKSAFRMLVHQLRPQERISIVTYAGSAGVVLYAVPGSQKDAILAAVDRLQAGGSTAGEQGILLAYRLAQDNFLSGGNNRIILATDGDFNVGVTSDAELVRLIEQKREEGIFLSVLGFGTGNYQDARMEKLADTGNGNYAYIDSLNEAQKVLIRELGSMLFTIAKDVKIQVEFNPAHVKAYRLIGYVNRTLAKEDFHDDTKDAGELGAGHSVTALYEIIPADSPREFPPIGGLRYQQTMVKESPDFLTVKLRCKRPHVSRSELLTQSLTLQDIRPKRASANFLFATSVAEFGLLLSESPYRADASYQRVMDRAQSALGLDPEGYRREFIRLVEKAGLLEYPDSDPMPAPPRE